MPLWSDPVDVDQKTVAILGNSGIVLGFEDEYGCRWFWESNDPWSPSPSVRAVTGDRATAHGSWDATRFYGSRRPEFKGTVVAPTHLALHQARQRLFDAVTVEAFPLRVIEPGFDRFATVRRDGEVLWTEMRNRKAATWSLSLAAPDPVVYSTQARELLAGPSSKDHVVTNDGGLAVAPVVTIVGATSSKVVLRCGTTNPRSLTITHPDGDPVVGDGQSLVVDMGRRTIRTGTGVSRRSWMTGQWWDLQRGDNDVHLDLLAGAGAAGASAGLAMDWREGWI